MLQLTNFIDGEARPAQTDRYADVFNPSNGTVIAQVPLSCPADVDAAVAAAYAASPQWQATPAIERARVMFRYREILEREIEPLAQLITREHGKTFAESRAEVRRGIEVVEFSCGIPSLLMGSSLPNVAESVDAEVLNFPVGVCVGITPYNFPAMVPMWMYPIALVCGNTFLLKPSEKVPLTALRLAELLTEASCPPGVFGVLNGDSSAAEQLIEHPHVGAISFVGSSPVAEEIYRRGTALGKRVQAAGGAKNHFIIMPDADPHLAIKALTASSFGCGGQRCMATSVAVAVGDIADELVDQTVAFTANLTVGPTDQGAAVDIGPLIRREHVERVSQYLDVAAAEGAEVRLDGRKSLAAPESREHEGFLLPPSILDHVTPTMSVAKNEIFGPVLSVIRAQTMDDVIELGKASAFGNGASIFTRDGHSARTFRQHFDAGMIGINVGVPAPMAWFPFSGWNGSFFGDLHVQGTDGIRFYTRPKVTLTRWMPNREADFRDPIWDERPAN
jgi:malonate-semialdehyde dehydrogenase (acetylating)/methylmalonate-semialdehyde dehydrogenase